MNQTNTVILCTWTVIGYIDQRSSWFLRLCTAGEKWIWLQLIGNCLNTCIWSISEELENCGKRFERSAFLSFLYNYYREYEIKMFPPAAALKSLKWTFKFCIFKLPQRAFGISENKNLVIHVNATFFFFLKIWTCMQMRFSANIDWNILACSSHKPFVWLIKYNAWAV